ncbi:MAG: cation acetate symporter [Candidatus Coatesbacteria bacterium]|nr:cation acetate symporter [Candidatus Coatesbacteria bacterium]
MNYEPSYLAIGIFLTFVAFVIWLSFYLARRTRSAAGYYAAGGRIHWSVNGIAFAGDYLSAASFLGICGMIATVGYDGFLYSIGYLAGWIVALFVVAEPMKRMGKYTFTDALDSKFQSKGIQLMAALSTLIVSMFYLIPQMVGAGALVKPLLGIPRDWGVIIVGSTVIIIVATAGMVSTTYVQFLKGGLLIVFSTVLVIALFTRGIDNTPDPGGGKKFHELKTLEAELGDDGTLVIPDTTYVVPPDWDKTPYWEKGFIKLFEDCTDCALPLVWRVEKNSPTKFTLTETLFVTVMEEGTVFYNGAAKEKHKFFQVGHLSEIRQDGKVVTETEPLGPVSFLKTIRDSTAVLWGKEIIKDGTDKVSVYYQKPTSGEQVMRPGLKFKVGGAPIETVNFISLMLALFFGTAALPHILIRYYTVKSPASARKSTIVAIAAIGFFYILTMYLGLGAMVNGVVDITDNNMSAPLLARSFGSFLFSVITAIAFATVLGTVSGLIIASTGAIAHDILDKLMGLRLSERAQVISGKVSAVLVGCIAIILGIVFKGMNVSFLVGWAFAVAASANLPSIIMLLFWKKTTKRGIAASIGVGIVSAVGLILFSPSMYVRYGKLASDAPFALDNPGIISIPLSFITLVVVSLLTQKNAASVKQNNRAEA